MGTSNFAFKNRCVVVTNDDFDYNNIPSYSNYDNNRNYPSYTLDEYDDKFKSLRIVITMGYYEDACIDYISDEIWLDDIFLAYEDYRVVAKAIIDEFKQFKQIDKKHIKNLIKDKMKCKTYQTECECFDKLQNYIFSLEKENADKIIDEIKEGYGYQEYNKVGTFSNGETVYELKK